MLNPRVGSKSILIDSNGTPMYGYVICKFGWLALYCCRKLRRSINLRSKTDIALEQESNKASIFK
jgi:hypothetical protein